MVWFGSSLDVGEVLEPLLDGEVVVGFVLVLVLMRINKFSTL